MKATPGWIGIVVVRPVIEGPLLVQVGLARSPFICTWNGGAPPVQVRTTSVPLREMLRASGDGAPARSRYDLIAFSLERSLIKIFSLVDRSTENSSQLAEPVLSK